MDARSGMLFVIEGTDGSGKATQLGLLRDRLTAAGYEVATFDFPQYEQPSCYFVKRYLNGEYGSADEVGPYACSLFYALDRFDAAEAMRIALAEGKIVLANRFVGSNMAHQGTKFLHVEERRGFYIWLDNLEFTLLNIPRPDMSFVLRVPAAIASGLIGKKDKQSHSENVRDIHEADMKHLETSVRIYDELCQLFPKDFKQIDCVRGGSILETDQIQQMLWEAVQPYLPPAPKKKPSVAPVKIPTPETSTVKSEEKPAATDTATPIKQPSTESTAPSLSALLAAHVGATLEQPKQSVRQGKMRYYVPPKLASELQERYDEVMYSLFELLAEMRHRIAPEHSALLRAVVPVAMLRSYVLSPHTLQEIQRMNNAEAHTLRQALKIGEGKPSSVFARANTLTRMAHDLLPESYAASAALRAKLVQVIPRSELDVLPKMLYPSSTLSLQDIETEVTKWRYEQKAAFYTAYLAAGNDPAHALASVQYTWDIVAPFAVLRDIQTVVPAAVLSWQMLTPRYGYDTPEEIDDAGLSDLFDRCFDISLELYSDLQAAGLHAEAQYATLHGHYAQCSVRMTAQQLRRLITLPRSTLAPDTAALITFMAEKLGEVHPLLAAKTV